jgi:glycosyltransferase involved in cell wall biosynthesis
VRLLQVVPVFASYSVFLKDLTAAMSRAGHSTALVCGAVPAADAASVAPTELWPLDLPRGSNVIRHWTTARELRRIIQAWQPDIVHTHFSAAMFSTALASRPDDPWVSFGTFHGLSFPMLTGARQRLMRRAETFAASRFDQVLVLTADDREALRRANPAVNVDVQGGCGLGCEDRFVDTPRPSLQARTAMRLDKGLGADDVVLIFVGRLVDFKGFDLAVRAFWSMKETLPTTKLVVVGAPDPLHASGLSAAEWQRYESDPSIIKAGTQRDVLPWLDLADLLVFPSQREGMPVCVMEGIARGLPVVAAPVRGSRELVADGRNGVLVATPTVDAWRSALMTLAALPVSERPRESPEACDRFRRSRWLDRSLQTYTETLRLRRSAPSRTSAFGRSARSQRNIR